MTQGVAHAGIHRAALVIEHGAGWSGTRVLFRCVQFAQDAVSGLALLQLAGANSGQPPQVYDWGGGAETVCQLDHEPTTIPDRCFGPTSGPNWSDWSLTSNGWTQRSSGASGYLVHDGDVEGWTYSNGFGAPPPATRFSQVCPPLAAAQVPTTTTRASVSRAAAVPSAQTPVASAPIATTSATASLEAIAPTVSPTARTALAETGSASSPTTRLPVGPIALIVVAVASLVTLAVINLRRRAP